MLSGRYNHQERPVKDKEGNQIMGEENQRKRWVEHFEEILNSSIKSCNNYTCRKWPWNQLQPSKQRGNKASNQSFEKWEGIWTRWNSSWGTESWETTVGLFYPLFNKIWCTKQILDEWKEGYLIKLPQKGDLSNCNNYRGIMLLSVPGKVLSRILLNRIKAVSYTHLTLPTICSV